MTGLCHDGTLLASPKIGHREVDGALGQTLHAALPVPSACISPSQWPCPSVDANVVN